MPDTSKPPTAFPLIGGPSSVSTQSAPEGIRTPNLLIRSQMLYPLSYGRLCSPSPAQRGPTIPATPHGDEIAVGQLTRSSITSYGPGCAVPASSGGMPSAGTTLRMSIATLAPSRRTSTSHP